LQADDDDDDKGGDDPQQNNNSGQDAPRSLSEFNAFSYHSAVIS
jgi:hypothetical protein